MTQKMAKKDGYTRATLADIAKEMAKPRLTESVREAAQLAEQAKRLRAPHVPRGKNQN